MPRPNWLFLVRVIVSHVPSQFLEITSSDAYSFLLSIINRAMSKVQLHCLRGIENANSPRWSACENANSPRCSSCENASPRRDVIDGCSK